MISMINNADDQKILKKLSHTNMETNELAHNLFQCCTEEEKARQPKCSKNLGFPPKSKK